jgi:hypothetical protein
MRTAIGFAIHTGWAAAVVLSDEPLVVARVRIALAEDDPAGEMHGPRFVYHLAAEKGDAEARVRAAERMAQQRGVAALAPLAKQHGIVVAALPAPKRALPPLAAILQSHALIHAAEGELYRRALEQACRSVGFTIMTEDAQAQGGSPLPIGKMPPPWGKDQKEAAARAWAALASLPAKPRNRSAASGSRR